MDRRRTRDFYELQRRQKRRSILVLAVLVVFYFLAIGIVALAAFLSFGALAAPRWLSASSLMRLLLWVLGVALLIAVFHYYDARKFGAAFIMKRLEAQKPDLSDRYHKQLADTVEEMRIASGLPQVRPYVIPSFAVNSMALIEKDGTPAVGVTEGLLADCTRDEMQAVAAHELAHVSRGDAFYVTLVCSLANFLERLREALVPEDTGDENARGGARGGAPPVLIYGALALSSFVMHLLSTLLSREREILADAAASEIGRNPAALARALYKAHLKSSFVGDFSLTYSPLFIIAPALSSDEEEGFWSRLLNSHPPLMKRIRLLAQQVRLRPAQVIDQVREEQREREEARTLVRSRAEVPASTPMETGMGGGPAPGRRAPIPAQTAVAKALNRCPRCRALLVDTFYEGVGVRACASCGGKLVPYSGLDRIILRREVTFSKALAAKAASFRQEVTLNPVKRQRVREKFLPGLCCPGCGQRMLARPYNYQYFVPVDKCLDCHKIWFDADELELLQILVEKRA
jgi:Zn-dependent protease with chaperone function/Zn-finger nucleic acid-binding protein